SQDRKELGRLAALATQLARPRVGLLHLWSSLALGSDQRRPEGHLQGQFLLHARRRLWQPLEQLEPPGEVANGLRIGIPPRGLRRPLAPIPPGPRGGGPALEMPRPAPPRPRGPAPHSRPPPAGQCAGAAARAAPPRSGRRPPADTGHGETDSSRPPSRPATPPAPPPARTAPGAPALHTTPRPAPRRPLLPPPPPP